MRLNASCNGLVKYKSDPVRLHNYLSVGLNEPRGGAPCVGKRTRRSYSYTTTRIASLLTVYKQNIPTVDCLVPPVMLSDSTENVLSRNGSHYS